MTEHTDTLKAKITLTASLNSAFDHILTPDALSFIQDLHLTFNHRRKELLTKRVERQKQIDQGEMPNFIPETKHIRESNWTVAPIPQDLKDRRVEITGPVQRKMVINALNSGAKIFMADFEDSNTPSWINNIQGQINLHDAIQKTITYTNPKNNKHYKLNDHVATLMVRPRGWHLEEKHITCNGENVSGSLVDFGLYFFHNAKLLIQHGSGPYFYLPKLESHLEARLWNDVFIYAQNQLGVPQKTIKATVLIETILASFELHEILYELRDHSAGLNCGRWDYIFSYIKKFKNRPGFILPDRAKVGMTTSFMNAYSQLVIQTCHKREVHAIGGMAAQIPIKNNPEANEKAMHKVREGKKLEVLNGHDGTWVAHPGMVAEVINIFNKHMPTANQIHNKRYDVCVTPQNLIEPPKGSITETGVRLNINVGILYIESWLRGNGAAAIYNLMEDAATAEISRTQLWQWIKNNSKLEDGRIINIELYEKLLDEELSNIKNYVGEDAYKNGKFKKAIEIFDDLIRDSHFVEFLTLPAYSFI